MSPLLTYWLPRAVVVWVSVACLVAAPVGAWLREVRECEEEVMRQL